MENYSRGRRGIEKLDALIRKLVIPAAYVSVMVVAAYLSRDNIARALLVADGGARTTAEVVRFEKFDVGAKSGPSHRPVVGFDAGGRVVETEIWGVTDEDVELGDEIEVRYDPDKPQVVLKAEVKWWDPLVAFAAVLTAAMAACFGVIWWLRRPSQPPP